MAGSAARDRARRAWRRRAGMAGLFHALGVVGMAPEPMPTGVGAAVEADAATE
jgi:hypothetical protein